MHRHLGQPALVSGGVFGFQPGDGLLDGHGLIVHGRRTIVETGDDCCPGRRVDFVVLPKIMSNRLWLFSEVEENDIQPDFC